MGPLQAALEQQRAAFAAAAQQVLDDWAQDADGVSEEFGTGGACDAIARVFSDVLCRLHYVNADGQPDMPSTMDGGQDGDDHAWLVVYDAFEAVELDLPPGVYETGGGYTWRKRPGVHVRPADIAIVKLRRSDINPDEDGY